MDSSTHSYEEIGAGTCKNITVEIDRALDESHHHLTIIVLAESVPTHIRIRLPSLKPARQLLTFMSDHIGTEKFAEWTARCGENSEVTLVKDPEFADRFFLKFFAEGIFIEQTFRGMAGASLMKALLAALQQAKQ